MLSYFLNIFTVFPTHVGMILVYICKMQGGCSIPHACEDDPPVKYLLLDELEYSPRMWG